MKDATLMSPAMEMWITNTRADENPLNANPLDLLLTLEEEEVDFEDFINGDDDYDE